MSGYHIPIMLGEVVTLLGCRSGGIYVDCTLGGGGHALEILKASAPDGRLIGIDRDGEAIEEAGGALERFRPRISLVQSSFARIGDILDKEGVEKVDGILVDLGVSSHQLDRSERGFSFAKEGPLDMRMDQGSGERASELLARLPERELERLIRDFGEERWAKRIARAIKAKGEIKTTLELARVIEGAVPRKFHPRNIHMATRTFQALRIALNEELGGLEEFIFNAADMLKTGGRMAVISFHSLEDRIIKRAFKALSRGCICPPDLPYCRCGHKAVLEIITKKPVIPSEREIELNPRSRSAKLRVAERV